MRSLHALIRVLSALPLAGQVAWAQPSASPVLRLPVEWITVDDGLPQGMVRAMLQDRDGFIWFGTKDGLVRTDGVHMRVFRKDTAAGSLCGDHITALLESRDGLLWVATEEHGICVFDPRTERFAAVQVEGGIAPADVEAPRLLREHADGTIWVVSIHGAIHVIRRSHEDGAHANATAVMLPLEAVYSGALPKGRITGLLTLPNGDVWVTDTLMLRVLGTEQHRLAVRGAYPLPGIRITPMKMGERTMLLHDPAHRRVLLLRGKAVHLCDERTGAPLGALATGLDMDLQGHFFLDSRNRLWMGAGHGGHASRMDLRSGRIEQFVFVAQNRAGDLSQPLVLSWLEDTEGNIWAGTGGFGAVKYRARSERFQRLREGRYATLVQPDLEGRYIVVGETHEWMNPPDGQVRPLAIRQALDAAQRVAIWGAVVVDPSGTEWTSAENDERRAATVFHLDPREGSRIVGFPLPEGEHPCEVLPGRGHELWISAYGDAYARIDRLIRVDTRTRRVTGRYRLPVPVQIAEYRAFSNWLVDADGTVRMGTLEGVMILHPDEGRWEHFAHRPEAPGGLPNTTIFSICPDPVEPERTLWVGTAGAGLARLDLATGRCEMVTTRNGLPNNVIYGILADERKNLWLSTNLGICRYDPRTGAVAHYTKDDGLCGNEFNRYSAHRGADGRFYFAGVDGVIAFDPEEFHRAEAASPTRLTGFRLADREVLAGITLRDAGRQPWLDSAITHKRAIELPYEEQMFTIAFACMDQSAPRKNIFRFRLRGFSDAWVENGNVPEATFTHLDPGDYTFEVQSRNSLGVWDPQGASLGITIIPPWWGTWWFRTMAVLLGVALLYGLYRYRLAQQLRLALVRDRIARDLHDEIGSTLSSVALFSEVAKRQGDGEGGVKGEMLERISQSTSRMMESMNDIVWAVNSRNDELLHVVQRMNEFAARMAEAGGFKLHLERNGLDPEQVLNMTQRKNLYLIFKEAVNNAAKYAHCNTLIVRISTDRKELRLVVEDDGVGLHAGGQGKPNGSGGNGRQNMRTRAEEIGGWLHIGPAEPTGTRVEMRFPFR